MENFQKGEFVDFEGNIHYVVVCGKYYDKGISFGFSITNPKDTFNMDRGEQIAESRCDTEQMYLEAPHGGFLRSELETFTKSYLDYLCNNPGITIKGYNTRKTKYYKKEKILDKLRSMTESERNFIKKVGQFTNKEISEIKQLSKVLCTDKLFQ
jgi:hypothetical protein